MSEKIKVAVVVGEHPYQIVPFQKAFESIDNIETYIQSLELFCACSKQERQWYDVVIFYNFHMNTPSEQSALYDLGETNQGIFVLHHGILAFPEWDVWADITGIKNRKFNFFYDQKVSYNIVNRIQLRLALMISA